MWSQFLPTALLHKLEKVHTAKTGSFMSVLFFIYDRDLKVSNSDFVVFITLSVYLTECVFPINFPYHPHDNRLFHVYVYTVCNLDECMCKL